VLVYLDAFRNGFVWDDVSLVLKNSAIPGSEAVRRNLEIVLGRRPGARPELGP